MNQIDVMKQALEALCEAHKVLRSSLVIEDAITALRQTIERAEKHAPVARFLRWGDPGTSSESISLVALAKLPPDGTLLYTHPTAQQPLTDEQINELINSLPTGYYGNPAIGLARAIEAAHDIGEVR